jgi:hypothetical protein
MIDTLPFLRPPSPVFKQIFIAGHFGRRCAGQPSEK